MKKEYISLEIEIITWQGDLGDICSMSPSDKINDDRDGDWSIGGDMTFD